MSPNPTLFPCPCGSAPLKLAGAARAPGAANVISPSEGVHAVSAQQCGFGRGVASGPQVSVALPVLRPVAPTGSIAAAVADRVAGQRPRSLAKSGLLRCCGCREGAGGVGVQGEPAGGGPDRRSRVAQRSANFLTQGVRRHRHTFCINQNWCTPDDRGLGGQQHSTARRLLRNRSRAADPTRRETWPL
jgi:hypothetical protein